MQKEFEVVFEEGEGLDKVEFKGMVTLKRLNFAEKNALEEEATDIRFAGESPIVRISTSKLKELSVLKGIVKSDLIKTIYVEDKVTKKPVLMPKEYPLNITGIKELPQEVGEKLFEQFTKLNTLGFREAAKPTQ